MLRKHFDSFSLILIMAFVVFLLLLSCYVSFPAVSKPVSLVNEFPDSLNRTESFTDLLSAFKTWDEHIGCAKFVEKQNVNERLTPSEGNGSGSLQVSGDAYDCNGMKLHHVTVLVKSWTWIPDNLDNLYVCKCGMSCLWTKSLVLADKPDALLFESTTPPYLRHAGDPLHVYLDLEVGRRRSGFEDIFISYHAGDDIQSTYAGSMFHNSRSHYVSTSKNNEIPVYWSSSRCLPRRDQIARHILSLLPHHSFGRCLNNVGGLDRALSMYPQCSTDMVGPPRWWDHLHCTMSHYKFVLAIENTVADSYVTEKLFYALDSGAVPIYFGAPNVMEFMPPHSIIDGSKYGSIEELASHVRALARDPVAYAEYHAWRRCGVLGNYGKTRALSLDTVPCRLCELISQKGGRSA